jgi:hypothetical protein
MVTTLLIKPQTSTALPSGKFISQEEIEIWRARQTDSYYSSEFQRVNSNANSFMTNPAADYYAGPTPPVVIADSGPAPQYQGRKICAAAFMYMLNGDATIGAAVKKQLQKQFRDPGVDFSNRTRWTTQVNDLSPGFMIAQWLQCLLYSYVYATGLFNEDERIEAKRWFYNAGKYFVDNTVPRLDGLYSDKENWILKNENLSTEIMYDGSPKVSNNALWYNNRRSVMLTFASLAGILTGDRELIDSGINFVKEWLFVATYPDGTTAEFERHGGSTTPYLGWAYASYNVHNAIMIADALARGGDSSLFGYHSSKGSAGTQGGDKSILTTIKHQIRYASGQINRTIHGAKITPFNPTWNSSFDTWYSQGNLWYEDAEIKNGYKRNFPTNNVATAGGHNSYSGVWGVLPSVKIMCFDMEGRVNVYPGRVVIRKNITLHEKLLFLFLGVILGVLILMIWSIISNW